MLIVVTCPECGRRYDVPARLAGKKVQCKQCAARFRVPRPMTLDQEPPRPGPSPLDLDLDGDLELDEGAEPIFPESPSPSARRPIVGWVVIAVCVAVVALAAAWSARGGVTP